MKNLTQILQVIAFLIITSSVYCQDYYWQGGNGFWHDPQMWYPNGVPQSNDEVYISKGTVNVDNGFSAEAKYVELHKTGVLVVHVGATLDVVGSNYDEGILNHGLVETYGDIASNGHPGGLFDGVGFRNFGKFNIYSGGSYSSTGCGGYALLNEQFSICTNEGEIEIINNGSGIRNHSKFVNLNSIEIEELDISHGITNHGDFSSEFGAIIRIQGKNHFGIISAEMGSLNQIPDFVNDGKIQIKDSDWWCITVWEGTFTNLSKGDIVLLESQHSGLSVSGWGTVENFGSLATYLNAQDGIRGSGLLINKGFIHSTYNGDNGIEFYDLGAGTPVSIVNQKEIQMYGNVGHDIVITDGELHNTDEGYIYTENSFEGSEIINDGIFSVWHNGSHNITFENNGVVEDVYNSLPNIQNNQIVIRPINGPLVANQVFPNVLDKASNSNTTINFGWFDQIANGNVAALYFFWSNSLFPNSFGASAPTLWMDVTIQSSGQSTRLRANVLNSSPLIQNQKYTPFTFEDLEQGPEFNIYPNPVVNSIKIDALVWKENPYLFKLYDISGREVYSKRVVENHHFDLPPTIKDGMYLGMLFDENEIVYKKKIVVAIGNVSTASY